LRLTVLTRSRTYRQLRALMAYLPPERLRQIRWVVAFSFIPGFVDLASVAVIARLMGALVEGKMEDRLPGVKVFGGDAIDQSLWLILIFAILSWLASFGKFGLQFLQQRLTARVWIDLSNRIHANVLAQGYEYHLSRSTAKLSALLLNHIKKTSYSVINPMLKMVGAVFSIILLSLGILVIGRWS
jgi:ATP-binding cassette, subfamily B, bacterial